MVLGLMYGSYTVILGATNVAKSGTVEMVISELVCVAIPCNLSFARIISPWASGTAQFQFPQAIKYVPGPDDGSGTMVVKPEDHGPGSEDPS
jgi:hypothetical protein